MLRKSLVMLATFFLLFLMATPALADVNLNINGKSYQPTSQPRIEEGSTLVPVDLAGKKLAGSPTKDTLTMKRARMWPLLSLS